MQLSHRLIAYLLDHGQGGIIITRSVDALVTMDRREALLMMGANMNAVLK
jgi:hypothetical protein